MLGAAGRAETGADEGRGSGRAEPSGEPAVEPGRDSAGRSGEGAVAGRAAGGGITGAALTDGVAPTGGEELALGTEEAGAGVSAEGEAVAAGVASFGASPPIMVALSEIRSCGTTGRSSTPSPPSLSPNKRWILSSRSASF